MDQLKRGHLLVDELKWGLLLVDHLKVGSLLVVQIKWVLMLVCQLKEVLILIDQLFGGCLLLDRTILGSWHNSPKKELFDQVWIEHSTWTSTFCCTNKLNEPEERGLILLIGQHNLQGQVGLMIYQRSIFRDGLRIWSFWNKKPNLQGHLKNAELMVENAESMEDCRMLQNHLSPAFIFNFVQKKGLQGYPLITSICTNLILNLQSFLSKIAILHNIL